MTPETHNLSVVLVWTALVLWSFRLLRNASALWDLRTALRNRHVIRIRGLGQNLRMIESVTRTHLYSVMRTRQPPPPSEVKNIDIPFSISTPSLGTTDPTGRGGLLGPRFTFSSAVSCTVQLLWGVEPSALTSHTLGGTEVRH